MNRPGQPRFQRRIAHSCSQLGNSHLRDGSRSEDQNGRVAMAEDRIEADTGTSELLCEIRDRVALITLNRPEARNALSDRLTPALRRMIKQCGDDPKVGALLITGAGNAFCAGGDVKGMGNNAKKAEITLEQRVADLQTKQRTLTGGFGAVRKPTIARLPGPP